MEIEDILQREVKWKEEVPGGVEFFAYIDGELCQLRMNDFPDEPLYTLTWKNSQIDLDDRPIKWDVPL